MRLIGWKLVGEQSIYKSRYQAEKQASPGQQIYTVWSEEPRPLHHPMVATKSSAGADLRSTMECVIKAGGNMIIPTGYYYDLPCAAEVRGRSGMGFRNNIAAHHGTIDEDYLDKEVYVKLYNHGTEDYKIEVGDRIAQIIPTGKKATDLFNIVEEDRVGGFGSSGQ